MSGMTVFKRDGRKESVAFDKITARINKLCYGLDSNHVDPIEITKKVVQGVHQGITTVELDNLAAETAAYLTVKHPDYAVLAARIAISNLHKETKKAFSAVIEDLYKYVNPRNGKPGPLISDETYDIIMKNRGVLDSAILYDRDFNYNFFGFKTLERSYLLRINGKVAERPQHMLMRVAVGIHGADIERVIETYNLMSIKAFTHASPTLFNAGTPQPQMSSCFLVTMQDDSIEGIYDTLKSCALISKTAGGIGLNIHCIRATGSYISGTNGSSNGIVPMLRAFDATARYVDQGGNKRPGAFAIYLEPWHPDVFEFLDLRKNHGKEEVRARDLFYALWIPDLFMQRVQENGDWPLFCPHEAPGLHEVWGKEFEQLFFKYEREGRSKKVVKAQKLWYSILDSQVETGGPFMLYKDHANAKSNQQNLGTIKNSNLCTEIIEYSAPDEVAVCNLASIALPSYIKDRRFDFKELHKVTKVLTRNLNRIIDVNYYPVKEARNSNMRHRPIGLGVQGLADAFQLLRFPFSSEEARLLNKQIFETIYHAAVESSTELATEFGPYETYQGSPASKGQLQYDLWNVQPTNLWDWNDLKQKVARCGLRNSLLVAPMPTASTSQILGFNECFEPYTSNIYTRRVLSGEFQIVNPWLLKDLCELGLWNDGMKNKIIAHGGSIQNISEIPYEIKELYKTVWEISQKVVIDLAADRGAFIDQSQSLNVHLASPTHAQLTSMHFYAHKRGLKTGMYYLRTRPQSAAIQFTVDKEALDEAKSAQSGKSTPTSAPTPPNILNGVERMKLEDKNSSTRSNAARNVSTPVRAATISRAVSGIENTSSIKRTLSSHIDIENDENNQPRGEEIVAGEETEDEDEIDFETAKARMEAKQLEQEKLICSIENKEASTLAGGAAGVVASVLTCPLDVIKTRLQAQKKSKGHTLDGVIDTVKKISHEQGYKGYYKGLGPTILGYLPTWAIYFTVYDEVKAILSSKRGDPDGVDWSTHMIASASAGATGATLTNPLWVVKTRFMTQEKGTIPYRHTLHALESIYKNEGMKGFYKGLIPSLVGVTHVVIQFPVYERLKLKMKKADNGELSTISLLACSSISKMMASVSTYPHEVVRTRLQVERRYHHGLNNRKILTVINDILSESGFKGLYKGLSVTLLRTVPNSAMTLLAYEMIMSELSKSRRK